MRSGGKVLWATFLGAAVLAGCGGGDAGSSATSSATAATERRADVASGLTYPLNDTGLRLCGNAVRNDLPCPVPGFPNQDAENGRDVTHNDPSDGAGGFSFTKLDEDGVDLATDATSWQCVRDDVTGRIWEVKTDDGTLHDVDNTYTWYNADARVNGGDVGVQNGGTCTGSACDTAAYVAAVNAQGRCGANDWRLPTIDELLSIVDSSRRSPTYAAYFGPARAGQYVSSAPYATYPDYVFHVRVFDGGRVDAFRKSVPRYVRLVRDGN